jgi:hypothetical protein
MGVKPPGRSFSTVAKPLLGSLVCLEIKYIQKEIVNKIDLKKKRAA